MRHPLLIGLLLAACACWADSQPGEVRTIARPGRPSVKLEGVMLRARGAHNAVTTDAHGCFSMLLPEVQAGQAFSLSSIVKSGYELQEKELIGRRLAFSTTVPLDICMVSRADLMADKAAIEEKARENIERYYQERLAALEAQLAQKTMSADQYQAELTALEEKYERFEPLLEAMSDRYARTDYSRLDEMTTKINAAIESGDLDEAERLIQSKGDLEKRKQAILSEQQAVAEAERRIAEARRLADARRKELADDYYHLYTIALSRFQNDSAMHFITARAELDSTNCSYLLDAGEFYFRYLADYHTAVRYFRRIVSLSDDAHVSLASALNDLGFYHYLKQQQDSAGQYIGQAREMFIEVLGAEHEYVANATNNLATVRYAEGDMKQALRLSNEALEMQVRLRGEKNKMVADIRNNQAAIYFQQKKYDKAEVLFLSALKINRALYGDFSDRAAQCLMNLCGVAYMQGRTDEAITYMQESVDVYQRVLPASHPARLAAEAQLKALKDMKK